MQIPLQISFHDVDHSEALEERVREKVKKVEHFFDHITSCRVVIEKPHKHNHQGKLFDVTIDLKIPGHEFVVKGEKGNHAHEDVYVALRNAFDALARQVKEYNERRKAASRQASE